MSSAESTDQVVRKILYLGPAPGDDDSVVVTMDLTCGCEVTRVLSERRIVRQEGSRCTVKGDVPCPKGHASPPWLNDRGQWFSHLFTSTRSGARQG